MKVDYLELMLEGVSRGSGLSVNNLLNQNNLQTLLESGMSLTVDRFASSVMRA